MKTQLHLQLLLGLFFSLIVLMPVNLNAQVQQTCGADEVLQEMLQLDPGMHLRMQQIEQQTNQFLQRRALQRASEEETEPSEVIVIPVVVHIVYNTEVQNIPDERVHLQIAELNEDMRRLNADTGNVRPMFAHLGADTRIEFCLATVDPNGFETDGITRTYTFITDFANHSWNNVKFDDWGGKDGWPPGEYLNIWVCRNSAVGGFAYYPGLTEEYLAYDGIVVALNSFNTIGNSTRTTTHEVGHYLNLRHIWGDGDCTVDDGVDDTPTQGQPNQVVGCPIGDPNSCIDSINDLPDMYENYMDYTFYCKNIFTHGQSDRMNAVLDSGAYRHSLLSSNGCGTGIPNPCGLPLNVVAIPVSNGYQFSWDPVPGVTSYAIRIKPFWTIDWINDTITATNYTFTNLVNCTKYEFRVAAICQGSESDYTQSLLFPIPGGLYVSNVKQRGATFNWDALPGASHYQLNIRVLGNTWSWSTYNNISGTSFTLNNNLNPNTTYEWRIRAYCTPPTTWDSEWSHWSQTLTFTTGQNVTCAVPAGVSASEITDNGATLAWNSAANAVYYNVRIQPQGSSVWDYAISTTTSYTFYNLLSCTDYVFEVGSLCTQGSSNYTSAYQFSTSGCVPGACNEPGSISASNITGTEATLSWATVTNADSYNTRLRTVGGSWISNNTTSASTTFSNLLACTDYEFELQSVCNGNVSNFSTMFSFATVGCPSTSCDVPDGIAVSGINSTSATVSWNVSSNALTYNVRIRPQGGSWTNDNTGNTSYTFSNLLSCTGYEVEVESVCDESASGYSATTGFSTTGCPPPSCAAPTGLFVSNINKKNARLNWDGVSGASQYEAQIWPQGSSNVNTYTTSNTNIMINGLNVGTTYEWHVRAECSGSWSPHSVVHSFVAGSSSKWDDPNDAQATFRVFPNPSTGMFTVEYDDGKERAFAVRVFDITGRLVYQAMQPGSALNMDIDLSALAEGTYLVVVADGAAVLDRTKVVLMGSR